MASKVEKVKEIENVELGEGPHWVEESQSLYFVDIFGKSIHRYVPATRKHTKAIIGTNHVSLIIPVKGEKDKFVISIGREIAVVTWDGESEKVSNIQKIYEVDNNPNAIDNRFNDGKCDPSGRLWAGTMGGEAANGEIKPEKGTLFSFQNKQVVSHVTQIGISNGLAWNIELNKFYYIDSFKGYIEEYDFDIQKGTICKYFTITPKLDIEMLLTHEYSHAHEQNKNKDLPNYLFSRSSNESITLASLLPLHSSCSM